MSALYAPASLHWADRHDEGRPDERPAGEAGRSLLGSRGFWLSRFAGSLLGGDLSSVVTGLLGPHGETLWLEHAVAGVAPGPSEGRAGAG